MRTRIARSLSAASAAVALVAVAGAARAQQIDTNPPLPNVMLLIDNSGSMERMINGSTPEADGNACNCVDKGPDAAISCPGWSQSPLPAAPQANRWNTLQTTLTGSLQGGFNCVAMPRTAGSTLVTEYQIDPASSNPLYDLDYHLPFHRLVAMDTSGASPVGCVVAPGGLPGAQLGHGVGPNGVAFPPPQWGADSYPPGSIVARQYGFLRASKACTSPTLGTVPGFPQWADGALTTMRDLMRFGMMTFDQDPNPATGLTSSDTVGTSPFTGMWTYFPGWASDPAGLSCTFWGEPLGCGTKSMMAVGARNPGAPPWEGRLVGFPSAPDLTAQRQNNDEVSNVILATRPYGATPLAGMFVGAKYYFFQDPNGPQVADPYVKGACRPEFVVLLTDGAPNLDLEIGSFVPPQKPTAACNPNGNPGCPFPLPQQTAAALYGTGQSTTSQASVKTFVIGFAVASFQDNGQLAQCSQFAKGGSMATQCNCNDQTLAAQQPYGPCCILQCIAQAGGTNNAYFADNPADLQAAIDAILGSIAQSTTTRTVPAYSPLTTNVLSSLNSPTTNESIFLASFNTGTFNNGAVQPWSGNVQRQRYVCTYSGSGFTIPPPTIQPLQGDDFAANLNSVSSGGSGPPRRFVAIQPAAVNGVIDSGTTIRPYAPSSSNGDKLGNTQVTVYSGAASTFDTSIPPQALALPPPGGCTYTSTVNGSQQTLKPPVCASMLLDFLTAESSFTGKPNDFHFLSRAGNAFGDVFHATPFVQGPPGSLLQDPGYVQFASPASVGNPYGWANRQNMIYVATNDGLLHAFWADENKLENNEKWAMILPGVMPALWSTYPSSHQFLLDGSPIVKDVVWDRSIANATTGTATVWHTMLVAGFGPYQKGYYGVDVTDPDPSQMPASAVNPSDPTPTMGPVFRWQLTTLPSTNMPLFGAHSVTPAITTLFMDPHDNLGPRDIGVAILPGGLDTTPSTQSACQRWNTSSATDPTAYPRRQYVRCWGTPHGNPPAQSYLDFVPGRSVTIVRIDTGEILRVFARTQDMSYYPNDTIKNIRFTSADFDSPMTGTPLVYPSDVGTDTTKFFIGDSDGTLWRFDVSNPDPNLWPSPTLYLDLYNAGVDKNAPNLNSPTGSWNDGQPFEVTPVVSLDPAGNLVINAATGSIQQYDTTGIEYVYSITEKAGSSGFQANVNWWMQPGQITNASGERVSGPMTVFDGTLYFATFAAAPPGSVCTVGTARLWGRHFVTPDDPNQLSLGGKRIMQPPPPNAPLPTPPPYIEPDQYDNSLAGKVIPGVSIKATPACANLGQPGPDQYVYGANHASPQNFTPGGYSLFTQVGAKGTSGNTTRQFEMPVATPVSPTVIDSWAAVLE
jgi:type IV pilus assembly protein PilY1